MENIFYRLRNILKSLMIWALFILRTLKICSLNVIETLPYRLITAALFRYALYLHEMDLPLAETNQK